MKRTTLALLVSATALSLAASSVTAQDSARTGPNRLAEAGSTPGPVADFALAQELFHLGRDQGDALLVLAAARLAAGVSLEDGPAMGPRKGPPAAAADTGPDATPATAEVMFDLAMELAGDDPSMQSVIEDARAEAGRGRIGGAVTWTSHLGRGQTDDWEIAFHGNEYAEIAIAGNGLSNLDLVLTDENGNVICADYSPADQIYCDFVPAWDGNFYISIENTGSQRNTYWLVTN